MKADRILVFDMDGVLVDVSESYRETIRVVVRHFGGPAPTHDEIQALKNQGGWNNDWMLSRHLIARAGIDVAYERVVEYFNEVFLGNGNEGMIRRERWIAAPGLLERLSRGWRLAIFTGRSRPEVEVTLRRFADEARFDPVVAADDVAKPKPAPDGLRQIGEARGGRELWYVGDTWDDARSAKAAGVPFVGVAAPSCRRRRELEDLFRAEGAKAVISDINALEAVLPA